MNELDDAAAGKIAAYGFLYSTTEDSSMEMSKLTDFWDFLKLGHTFATHACISSFN